MTGNKVIVQYGLEDTYGTLGAATKQIQSTSEGFKYVPVKKEEGLLTGSRLPGKIRTVAESVDGALSTLARPDDIGLFLAVALGNEGTATKVIGSTGAYTRDFTVTSSDTLRSLFFKVMREEGIVKGYTGITVDGLTFDAAKEDMLKVNFTYKGKIEVDTDLEDGLSVSPLAPFRLAYSTVKVAGTDLEVVSTKFDLKNNLDASTQTNKTGIGYKQPEVGQLDLVTEFSVAYDATCEAIRNGYWRTDNLCSVEIDFLSGEEVEDGYPYSLKIVLPANQITNADVNVGGKDRTMVPLKLKSVENGDTPITVTLVNGFSGQYLI